MNGGKYVFLIIRNHIKCEGKDQEFFFREVLEDVFFDHKDGFWRYIVSMGYIKQNQKLGNEIRH